MDKKEFTEKIEYIIAQLREAGYEPYDQLTGYVKLGKLDYITRRGNAREVVKELDAGDIRDYLIQNGMKL